mgnify:CR=1 FL=1
MVDNCFEQRQFFIMYRSNTVSQIMLYLKTPFYRGFPPLSPSHVTGNATSLRRWIELIKTKKMVSVCVCVTKIDLYVRVLIPLRLLCWVGSTKSAFGRIVPDLHTSPIFHLRFPVDFVFDNFVALYHQASQLWASCIVLANDCDFEVCSV